MNFNGVNGFNPKPTVDPEFNKLNEKIAKEARENRPKDDMTYKPKDSVDDRPMDPGMVIDKDNSFDLKELKKFEYKPEIFDLPKPD